MNNDPIADVLVLLGKGIWKGSVAVIKGSYRVVRWTFNKSSRTKRVPSKMQYAMTKGFEEIGFKDKIGNYPICTRYHYDKKSRIHSYLFEASIPLDVWLSRQLEISVALDKNIQRIKSFGSKKKVQIIALDNNIQLPSMAKWSWNDFLDDDATFVIGKDLLGNIVRVDMNETPNLLSGGTVGSGKSVTLQLVVGQALRKGWALAFIDFKQVEFSKEFEKYGPVAHELEDAVKILENLSQENLDRMELFERSGVKKIAEYNEKYPDKPLSYTAVVIDELAELLDKKTATKENHPLIDSAKGLLTTIARRGRAQGVFIFTAIQRPAADVLTGQIRDMLNVRACGYFVNKEAYEMTLGSEGKHFRSTDFMDESATTDDDFLNPQLEEKNVAGRLAFMAGGLPRMIQSFYFEGYQMNGIDVSQKGMMCSYHHQRKSTKTTSLPLEQKLEDIPEEISHQESNELNFDFDE